jgi:tetratricopeptide (TPR) repeat protein
MHASDPPSITRVRPISNAEPGAVMNRSLFASMLWILILTAGPPAAAQTPRVDVRAEVSQALYAASATQAAAERAASDRLRAQRTQIERLQEQLRAGAANAAQLRTALATAQDEYVAALSTRDRAYAQEIAVFRSSLQGIASTPEGAAALAQFNRGDEAGALSILDQLRAARKSARQRRTEIENAAEDRQVAGLALEARSRGKADIAQVIARFEEVTRQDPGVHWDWVTLTRLYRVGARLADARRAAQSALSTASHDGERAQALDELGDVLQTLGDQAGALASFESARDTLARLSAAQPGDVEAERELTVAYDRVGNALLARGDDGGALVQYQRSFDISARLARTYPDDADRQRDLSFSHTKIGDVLTARRDFAGARDRYESALAIRQRLAAQDPANVSRWRDVMLTLGKVGDAWAALGDQPRALSRFEESLAIAERLAAADRGDTDAQRNVAVTQVLIGDALETSDAATAASRYERARDIFAALSRAEPDNAVHQRDLSGVLYRLGDVQFRGKAVAAGLASYRDAIAISERLTAAQPTVRSLRLLSSAYITVGDVLLEQEQRPQAAASFEAARAIRVQLAAAAPGDGDQQRLLIVSLVKLQDATGNKAYAVEAISVAEAMNKRGLLTARDGPMMTELGERLKR